MSIAPPAAIVDPLVGSQATSVVWRARGRLHVTVIAKATFALVPGGDMTRVAPQEVITQEVHHDDMVTRTVRFTTDLAPFLLRADVVFTGHAHAPAGARVTSLPLRLAVLAGDRPIIDKRLEARDPAGFVRMPVVYERALGGDGVAENAFGTPEPSLVDPAQPGRIACFGPIGWAWPVRRRLLGALRRLNLEAPVVQIPDDFDGAYFQSAPPDQQAEALRGDELVVLEGLTAGGRKVRSRLPDVRGVARIVGREAASPEAEEMLDLALDTLRIDGDANECTVVARASLVVPDEAALSTLRIFAAVETAGARAAWNEVAARRSKAAVVDPTRGHGEEDGDEPTLHRRPKLASTLSIEPTGDDTAARDKAPPLPFQQGTATPEIAFSAPRPAPAPRKGSEETIVARNDSLVSGRPDLPFITKGPAAPATAPGETRAPSRPKAPPPLPAKIAGQGRQSAPASALAASNAAAFPPAKIAVPEVVAAATPGKTAPDARPEVSPALDLLWFDPRMLPRARKQRAWQPLLDALRAKAPDPDIDDPALHADPAAGEERREIFEILALGEALGVDGLRAAMQAALRDDGRFVPPLVLLAGELALPFDEVEALRALVGAITPLAGNDEALRGPLEAARDLLSARDVPSPHALAESLGARLREAYGKRSRALPLAQIDAQVERALLDGRHHQRRAVFGGRHLRGLWHLLDRGPARPESGASRVAKAGIPAYLPDALAQVLPIYPRLSVRAVVEAHLAVHVHESHPVALRVLSLARSVPMPVF